MKITPGGLTQAMVTTSPELPAQAQTREARPVLKMNTNATPLRAAPPPPPAAPAAPGVGIPDPSDPAQRQPEATEPLSPQAAALARQRRALQVKERELTAREEALKSQTPAQGAAIDLARLKAEPLSVLQEAGITYDQLSQAILSQAQGVSPEQFRALQQKLEALEVGVDKKLTAQAEQGRAEAIKAMTQEAHDLVAQGGEEYEVVRATQSVPAAIKLIERVYDTTGRVLDVREALAEIEAEKLQDILKVGAISKVQGQMGQKAPAPAQAPQSRPPMRTLSNRDTAQAPASAKARALAAFWGQQTN